MQNNNSERKRFTVWDCVLIAFLVCTAIILVTINLQKSEDSLSVVVKKNSKIVYTQSLSEISDATELCVDREYNIVLCVMNDGVEIKSSDCSDKICVNTGKINRVGQSIVCLPAHVSVELKGSGQEVDVVVG